MINAIKNFISKNTGLLIRIDDIAENMNWKLMDKCESAFDKLNIRPLLGIIPNNKDPELLKYPKNSNFWERVRSWDKKGWEVSMHGLNHLYDKETQKKDYFCYGGGSEFYGHSYEDQRSKIIDGINKFKSEGLKIRSFFAPNHTYDINTLKALNECGIKIVIDGYGLFPFSKYNLIFVPQLFYKEIILPFGIQSTQIHLNYWKDEDFMRFENLIFKNKNKIINLENILIQNKENFFKNTINLSVEIFLKNARKLK